MKTGGTCFAALVVLGCLACGGGGPERRSSRIAPVPRRTVVWLTEEGINADTAARLAAVGVDELVVRRGSVLLAGSAPVVQLRQPPPVEGSIPTAVALEIRGLTSEADEDSAAAVWSALANDFGDDLPAELIVDVLDLTEGAGDFVSGLARRSGLAVVPVLSTSQLQTEAGRAVVAAAHGCIVPVFGTRGTELRGIGDSAKQPLDIKLAAIGDLGVRVRLAVALRPRTEPTVRGWAEDVDPLTDEENAEIKRTSVLDRSFLVKRPMSWGGLTWSVGQTIAVTWVDTARLRSFFEESHRIVLPEVVGWDLVTLPPEGENLGLDREELILFLDGEGPQPTIDVRLRRSGRNLTIEVRNTGVFRSTITGYGNWVQVELDAGSLVAESRGGFDRIVLGSVGSGEWQPNPVGGPDAVRFLETYVAPGEELLSGTIRLPSSRSSVTVRWHIQLSDGTVIEGVAS